jgi:hypothetical protein
MGACERDSCLGSQSYCHYFDIDDRIKKNIQKEFTRLVAISKCCISIGSNFVSLVIPLRVSVALQN